MEPYVRTVVGTKSRNMFEMIIPRTNRKILLSQMTKCSLEYRTNDCPIIIVHHPIVVIVIGTHVAVVSSKSLIRKPIECSRTPIVVVINRLQK